MAKALGFISAASVTAVVAILALPLAPIVAVPAFFTANAFFSVGHKSFKGFVLANGEKTKTENEIAVAEDELEAVSNIDNEIFQTGGVNEDIQTRVPAIANALDSRGAPSAETLCARYGLDTHPTTWFFLGEQPGIFFPKMREVWNHGAKALMLYRSVNDDTTLIPDPKMRERFSSLMMARVWRDQNILPDVDCGRGFAYNDEFNARKEQAIEPTSPTAMPMPARSAAISL